LFKSLVLSTFARLTIALEIPETVLVNVGLSISAFNNELLSTSVLVYVVD